MRIKNMFIQLAYRYKILSATKTNYRVNSINRFELHYISAESSNSVINDDKYIIELSIT